MNKNLERMYNRKKVLAVLCVTVSCLTILLPDDCSDKALLEYPGFDKAWEKYLSQEGL